MHALGGTRGGGGGGGGGGGVKEKNARAAVMMFRERQQQQHEDEVVNGGEENEVLYRMNANGEYGLGESASRRQELDMNRRLGSGRATSTRGFGFDNVKSSVFESIRFAPAASKTRAGAAGGNSMMMTQYAVNKAAAPGAARVYGGAMPAGRAHARLGSAMDEEPHATGGGGGTSHLMFNAGAQEAVFDLRNRLGGDGTLYHAQYQPRRHGRAAARRGGSGRTTSSRTFTLNVEDMHRRVRQERAKKITTTQNVRAVRFEEELRFNENDDDDDNNNIYEAADGMHAGVDNGSLTHNADMALSPIDGTQAFETGAPVPVSVHKTPDTVGMAALLVGLGDVEALQPDNDEAAAANDTPITPAVQLAYDDEAQDDMPAPVNDDDDDDDDAVNDDFGGFDNDVYDDDVEAAVVVPDKPKAPRVKKTPNRRLKKDFASRKSLAGHGIKLDVDTGVRRSTRTRMRPLEYWRNEKKSYGRSHNSTFLKHVVHITHMMI